MPLIILGFRRGKGKKGKERKKGKKEKRKALLDLDLTPFNPDRP